MVKSKTLHPKSRKALKILSESHRLQKLSKSHNIHNEKQNLKIRKFSWFKDHIIQRNIQKQLHKPDLRHIVECYLRRFDEELEQIKLVNNMKDRKGQRHAARQTAIELTLGIDKMNYENGVGIEIPDLGNIDCLKTFRNWDGRENTLSTIPTIFIRKNV